MLLESCYNQTEVALESILSVMTTFASRTFAPTAGGGLALPTLRTSVVSRIK